MCAAILTSLAHISLEPCSTTASEAVTRSRASPPVQTRIGRAQVTPTLCDTTTANSISKEHVGNLVDLCSVDKTAVSREYRKQNTHTRARAHTDRWTHMHTHKHTHTRACAHMHTWTHTHWRYEETMCNTRVATIHYSTEDLFL